MYICYLSHRLCLAKLTTCARLRLVLRFHIKSMLLADLHKTLRVTKLNLLNKQQLGISDRLSIYF